eukprot:5423272-Amphidinium_carterae.1
MFGLRIVFQTESGLVGVFICRGDTCHKLLALAPHQELKAYQMAKIDPSTTSIAVQTAYITQ